MFRSCLAISTIRLEYPEPSKRLIASDAPIHTLGGILSSILTTTQLRTLSVHHLEIDDLPDCSESPHLEPRYVGLATNLRSLALEVRSFQSSEDETATQDPIPARRLPHLIAQFPSLTDLCIYFVRIDKRLRHVSWSDVRCTMLKRVELRNLEISERSLKSIICSSKQSISVIILDSIFLVEGIWATFYSHLLEHYPSIIDAAGLHGRRYLDDRRSYSQRDARSWRALFKDIDRRRIAINLPSMTAPIRTKSMEYFHDFGDMEFSFEEN